MSMPLWLRPHRIPNSEDTHPEGAGSADGLDLEAANEPDEGLLFLRECVGLFAEFVEPQRELGPGCLVCRT